MKNKIVSIVSIASILLLTACPSLPILPPKTASLDICKSDIHTYDYTGTGKLPIQTIRNMLQSDCTLHILCGYEIKYPNVCKGDPAI